MLAKGSSMEPSNKWFDVVTQPASGSGSNTTFDAQSTYIFPFMCSNGKSFFLWMGDRWNIRGPGGVRMSIAVLNLQPPSPWSIPLFADAHGPREDKCPRKFGIRDVAVPVHADSTLKCGFQVTITTRLCPTALKLSLWCRQRFRLPASGLALALVLVLMFLSGLVLCENVQGTKYIGYQGQKGALLPPLL